MQQRSGSSSDLEVELGIYLHNTLRSPETAKPLVQELFSELSKYAQYKAHDILDMFHNDARVLLNMTRRPLGAADDVQHRHPQMYRNDAYGRHMRQMSWLCHHASETCLDLSDSIQNNQTLSHAQPLIQQLQTMLSAMSLTYDHLGAESGAVRSHDRHELATHFALMIHLLPATTAPLRSNNSPESAYLDKYAICQLLKQNSGFVEEAFNTDLTETHCFAEFFHHFHARLIII